MEVEKNNRLPKKEATNKRPNTTLVIVKERNKIEIEDRGDENIEEANIFHGLHILSVVGCCVLFASPIILIPQHDSIQLPEYWYELLMTFSLTYPIQWTVCAIIDNHFLLHIKRLASPKACLVLAFSTALTFSLTYCGLYGIWTYTLGYNFPMPLVCWISHLFFFQFLVTLWHLFPKEMRINEDSRKRLTSYIWYFIWAMFSSMPYNSLQIGLKKMPQAAQPIMAIVLPLMRSVDAKIIKTTLTKCAIGDNLVKEAFACIMSNANLLLYVTVSISTNATTATTFCILLVDVVGNFYHCYCIVKLHRKVGLDELQLKMRIAEKEKEVQMLALSEVLEIMVPLSFTLSFIVAYYGPNAKILRSVKNEYWGSSVNTDIGTVLTTEALLFSVDFTSLLVSIACLRYICRINLLKEFCLVLKKYWLFIAAYAGSMITKVCSILNEIHCPFI